MILEAGLLGCLSSSSAAQFEGKGSIGKGFVLPFVEVICRETGGGDTTVRLHRSFLS